MWEGQADLQCEVVLPRHLWSSYPKAVGHRYYDHNRLQQCISKTEQSPSFYR